MRQRKAIIQSIVALLLAAAPIAATAGERHETEPRDRGHPGADCQIEQITGNYQSTRQTGADNTASVVQSGVASGYLPGGANVALITQEGTGNQTAVGQHGSGLEATIGQDGNGNTASIDQSGAGLKASVQQFGDNGGVQVFQSGVGNGIPVAVRQY
jgi:minor curlin subunit